jgi:hypothetical protein
MNKFSRKTNDCLYSVGNDSSGQTVLRISDGNATDVTITMNYIAVRRMIRLLAASIETHDDSNNETDDEEWNGDGYYGTPPEEFHV